MVLDGSEEGTVNRMVDCREACFRGRRRSGLAVELEQTSGRKVEALIGQ